MQTLIGIAGFGLLVAIGFGVFRVHQDTTFLASVVQNNMDEAAQQMAQLTGEVEEDEDDQGTRPIGFHSLPSKRN